SIFCRLKLSATELLVVNRQVEGLCIAYRNIRAAQVNHQIPWTDLWKVHPLEHPHERSTVRPAGGGGAGRGRWPLADRWSEGVLPGGNWSVIGTVHPGGHGVARG